MNKDSKEYQRVRREMDNKLVEIVSWNWHDNPDQCLTDALDEILSIRGLAILADDQVFPINPHKSNYCWSSRKTYNKAQEDMSDAGFKKVI